VLCEKPFMINEKEALEVIAAAKEKNVYIMEGISSLLPPTLPETITANINESPKLSGPVSSPWSKTCSACYTRRK
jgi:hypothetical protein